MLCQLSGRRRPTKNIENALLSEFLSRAEHTVEPCFSLRLRTLTPHHLLLALGRLGLNRALRRGKTASALRPATLTVPETFDLASPKLT